MAEMQAAPKTRQRLLACDAGCGYKARVSRAMIARGLPGCPCGGRLVPATLEDAELAHAHGHLSDDELAAHPEAEAFRRELARVLHGRAGSHAHVNFGEAVAKTADGRLSPDQLAWKRLLKARRTEAVESQRAALKAHAFGVDAAASEEPIPF